jgi:hypothetical protein
MLNTDPSTIKGFEHFTPLQTPCDNKQRKTAYEHTPMSNPVAVVSLTDFFHPSRPLTAEPSFHELRTPLNSPEANSLQALGGHTASYVTLQQSEKPTQQEREQRKV